ncbi:MAG: argininosuccinate lyase [Chitinophagaceae bacterium]|jgi:argininosuccinate lyase|nr:argininosuccinate lyase [Chitinophagaceae bacterium]
MKLWNKDNTHTSARVEAFTVGRDREFDLLLAKHDVQGSIAHVTMLSECGLMSAEDAQKALDGLAGIASEIEKGGFIIEDGVEDVHSQVELLLTRRIGEAGKMIHSGRSRNDQVAVDIKLFLREAITRTRDCSLELFNCLLTRSEELKDVLLPGYTHLQVAMPSSFGLWLGAYAESLTDDMEMLAAAYAVADKNPLGSGAGYGSSFPLNRRRTTELLGFGTLNWNAAYAQMSRGKTEKLTAMALASIAATLGRLSMDACLYLGQDMGFISFPPELTTGSSIMPHKKNPDVFEMIRGKCNRIQSLPNELTLLAANLPSGYHREMQLTKEILFPAFRELEDCIGMMILMISHMEVRKDILTADKYKYIFSVEAVNRLVNQGIPFREAYQQIGNDIEQGKFNFDPTQPLNHTHEGGIGNLCNAEISHEMNSVLQRFGRNKYNTNSNA